MAEKLYDYDPADALKSDEAIEVFLSDAFESGDARYIASALGVVARVKGMTKLPGKRAWRGSNSTSRSARTEIPRSKPRSP